jgi:hypothetical protein
VEVEVLVCSVQNSPVQVLQASVCVYVPRCVAEVDGIGVTIERRR